MNPSFWSFRVRILVLAIVAIAWIAATRDSPSEVDGQANVAQTAAGSHAVATGKTDDDTNRR